MNESLFPQHTYPGYVPGGGTLRCKRCGEKIPDGKFDCPTCLMALSHQHYLDHQKRYADLIARSKIELTLVYIPGGEGERSPLWHLQRFGDIRHAYCEVDLPAGNRQDHLKYYEMHTRDKFCPNCAEVLAKVLHDVPADRTENPNVRS